MLFVYVVGQLPGPLVLSLKNLWLSLSVEVRCGSVPLQLQDGRTSSCGRKCPVGVRS